MDHVWPHTFRPQDGFEREDPVREPQGRGGRRQAPTGGAAALGEERGGARVDGTSPQEE